MDRLSGILHGIRPEFEFKPGQDFLAEGMLDSFDILTLVHDLEQHFGVSIQGIDILAQNLSSLEAIRALLARYGVTEWT